MNGFFGWRNVRRADVSGTAALYMQKQMRCQSFLSGQLEGMNSKVALTPAE